MAHPLVYVAVAALVVLVGLSVAPYPGHCNVQVSVSVSQTPLVVASYFTINSASATTTGPAQILDWSAWLGGLAPPALTGSFKMTVTADSGQSTTKTETQWFPTIQAGTATDNFQLGQVPTGPHSFGVTLYQNSQPVATGSASTNVGC